MCLEDLCFCFKFPVVFPRRMMTSVRHETEPMQNGRMQKFISRSLTKCLVPIPMLLQLTITWCHQKNNNKVHLLRQHNVLHKFEQGSMNTSSFSLLFPYANIYWLRDYGSRHLMWCNRGWVFWSLSETTCNQSGYEPLNLENGSKAQWFSTPPFHPEIWITQLPNRTQDKLKGWCIFSWYSIKDPFKIQVLTAQKFSRSNQHPRPRFRLPRSNSHTDCSILIGCIL